MLTKKQLDYITRLQIERQREFKKIPKKGIKVRYLGKEFVVLKNVFAPFDDSMPLVENYQINPGEEVLDVCTGSGVIAIFSAYKRAKKVVALDINPEAVKCAKVNVKLHGFSHIIDVRLSDVFSAVRKDEKFNVITGNLPFRDKRAPDLVAASQWDTNLKAHRDFFSAVKNYLKPNGRIYLSQANFGAVKEMKEMARKAGLRMKLIGKKEMPQNDPRIFYAFLVHP